MFSSFSNPTTEADCQGTTCNYYWEFECGVPQGSILDPMLFNIYIFAVFSFKCNGEAISFGDDTAIFFEGES